MLKSPRILSFFSSSKNEENGTPASAQDHGDRYPDAEVAAAQRPSSTRAHMVQRLETELHEQLESLLAAEREMHDGRVEIASLRRTIQGQATDLSGLRATLATVERERDATQQELSRSRAALQGLQQEHDSLQAKETTQSEQLRSYRDAIIGLEQAIAEKETALSERTRELTELAAALGELERSDAELRGRYAELEPANAKLQAVVAESNKTIERLTNEVHRAEASSDRFAHQLTEQKTTEKSLRSELASVQSDKADLAEQLAEVASALEKARKELVSGAELRDVKAALEKERANAVKLLADIEQRDSQIAELFHEVDNAVRQTGSARAATAQLDAKLRTMGDEHEKALVQLKQEWLEVTEENDRIHAMLEQKDAEVAASRLEMQQIQAAHENLDDEVDSLKCLVEELELELRNKRMLIATLEREGGRRAANDTTQAMQVAEAGETATADEATVVVQPRSLVTQGERHKQYPLIKPTIILGRSSDCDIRIGGTYTSRHHARLVTDGNGTIIEDLDSINGVQVNSETVKSCRLHDGDTIQIGKNLFKFVDPHEARTADH